MKKQYIIIGIETSYKYSTSGDWEIDSPLNRDLIFNTEDEALDFILKNLSGRYIIVPYIDNSL